MIEGVVGYPGQGKTYYACYRANKELKKGRAVYCNFAIKGTKRITPESMFDIEAGALVILDEAQNWFGARNWKEFGNKYMEFFSQTRKKEYTLLWISQDASSVDKTIRDRTNLIYRMEAMWGALFGHPLYFKIFCYYGAKNIDKEKHLASTRWILFRKDIANSYDTHEIVGSRLIDEAKI
jgi:zona occludens toxin (predicted ATPase)